MKMIPLLFVVLLILSCDKARQDNTGVPDERVGSAKNATTLKMAHGRDDRLEFERSEPKSEVVGYGVMDMNKSLQWYVKMGGRDVSIIQYGKTPKGKAGDSKMEPKQAFPAKARPRALKVGETVIVYFEFSKDHLLMAPSTATEAWKVVVPDVGKEGWGTRLTREEFP